ncbi:hypothetical protein [Desulfurobacterium sp.]
MNFVNKCNWINILFLLSVAVLAGLPSGYITSIPIKLLFSFLILLIFFLFERDIYLSRTFVVCLLMFLCFLSLYLLVGYLEFGIYSLKEYELMLITLVLFAIVYLLLLNKFNIQFFVRLVEAGIIVAFLVKFMALLYVHYHPGVNSMIFFFTKYFNIEVVTMRLAPGIYRINFPSDILAAFFPWVLVWYRKNNLYVMKANDFFVLLLSSFIVLLGFSRYLILVFATGLIYLFKLLRVNLNILKISSLAIFILLRESIINFIKLRFFSGAVKVSDTIRIEQTPILIKLFLKKPLIGHGIGAFSFEYVRSKSMCFSYEEQILTFFAKFGILGMSFLLGITLIILLIFISRRDYTAVVVFLFFIMAGWFNPYLYSSSVFLVYVFIGLMLNNENFQTEEVHAI